MMPQRNQEKDSATAASIWFEIWGSWIRVKKIRFLQGNFRKIWLPATPLRKIWGSRPSAPGLAPLDSNGKEAFSRRKELPRGGLRRMKMPQVKNGENTDLRCDLVLCRNKDYE